MALRNIVKKGDDVLTKMCRPVEKFDEKLCTLLDDMYETMEDANGVGLAAPQVGLLRRIVVIDVGEGRIELINPEIIKTSGEQDGAEGCLSFPGEFGMVKRPMNVTVRAQDRNGKTFEISGTELLARAFCHEIDHLNGVCFVTRASRMLEPDGKLRQNLEKKEEFPCASYSWAHRILPYRASTRFWSAAMRFWRSIPSRISRRAGGTSCCRRP